METTEEFALTPCPNCGAFDRGTYCSACGAEMNAVHRHPYRVFLDTFFKLREIRTYLWGYAALIRSPTRNTIRAFEEGHLQGALRFAEWSLGIYTVLVVSRVVTLKTHDWIAGILLTLMALVAWSVTFGVYYRLMRKKSPQKRSFRAFLTMACLYIGFALPLISLGQWFQFVVPLFGIPVLFALSVLLLVYAVRVWRYFWALPGKTVFGYLLLSSLVGGASSYVFIFIVFSLFPGSRFGLFEFDRFLSIDVSQFSDPFLHVHIDGVEPYTHPQGLFSIDAPEDWLLVKKDTLNEYVTDWQHPSGPGLISVHVIHDDSEREPSALIRGFVHAKFKNPFLILSDSVVHYGERVQLSFSYSTYGSSLWGDFSLFTMQGVTYVWRHGPALFMFSTTVPTRQAKKLEPQLDHILNSLEIGALPEAWSPPSDDPGALLPPIEITRLIRYAHPSGVFSLDVPANWQRTNYDVPGDFTVQWQDLSLNGLIVVKALFSATDVSDAELVEQMRRLLLLSFARDSTFSIDDTAWEPGGRLRLDFSYDFFLWWDVNHPTVVMRGNAYVERRHSYILVFCTILPEAQVEALTPQLTRIRDSIELYAGPGTR